ncbi:Rossmann-like and DUF2520 domain-containing protein [Alkaliphilus hydrothermalis]|uniref:Short-subunit dehydrogenase-like oxidoreductase (DUF2520 family) n=1 Tax=Alkaliphilus hydrothermalis TaxID=1482730 RepID=A0ABS2NQL1_9FIRM|nr:Rossmann-like and DUF2520 domain-containing protein [Alkaliphilus hydrothermalis]MBM7615248.1 putative short-subunit dehydrogenase-like oxidoreductase (DUF2520 family) [Alkaliphilus hydrothermalis]
MKIGFIGAGKVGKSFGKYLEMKGIPVIGYFSKSIESAQEAVAYVGGEIFPTIEELVKVATVIFITTPDDIISDVANEIGNLNETQESKIFVHMSGAHSSKILIKIQQRHRKSYLYSLHPLQAFASVTTATEDLEKTIFSLEGDEEKLMELTELLDTCGNEYFILKGEDKALYHSAACVVSNYLVTLMDLGLSLFEAAGIQRQKGFEALFPLIQGSLNNIKNLGTAEALTGPIARGDVNTIKNHLKGMEEKAPQLIELYRILGEETTRLAEIKKLKKQENIDALNQIWKEGI